jgi:hypothetical protein
MVSFATGWDRTRLFRIVAPHREGGYAQAESELTVKSDDIQRYTKVHRSVGRDKFVRCGDKSLVRAEGSERRRRGTIDCSQHVQSCANESRIIEAHGRRDRELPELEALEAPSPPVRIWCENAESRSYFHVLIRTCVSVRGNSSRTVAS